MQSWFVTHRKELEEVDFVDEELLHKKVNKNGVYMRIMMCYRRYSRRHKAAWVKHYGDLTVKNRRRGLRYCSFILVKPVGYFWLIYFVFSLVLAKLKDLILDFGFLSNLPAFATWSSLVGRWAVLITLNRVNRWPLTDST